MLLLNNIALILMFLKSLAFSHPDEKLSITQMITKYKYPVEEHKIETEDGYLLTTFRIPYGRDNDNQPKKVVIVAHGLASSADDWVILGATSLPYLLADDGYDVWLFNARGTRHSKKHKKLDPKKSEFWNFCWDEIGMYDLPANIDYILNHTGAEKIFYVGHSQGCTTNLVMLSQRPQFNAKIIFAALLAPAAYFENIKDTVPLRIFSLIYSPKTRYPTFSEFPPQNNFYSNNMSRDICASSSLLLALCYNSIYFGFNVNKHPIEPALVPVIAEHAPSTFSTKQIYHYRQIMASGEFKRFDYGERSNLKIYGHKKPPLYPIDRVNVPMVIFYGNADFLASPMSVKRLARELKNEHQVYEVAFQEFDHIDFLWAKNAKQLIYDKILQLFKNCSA